MFKSTNLHELIERQVSETPSLTAIMHNSRRITYLEMNIKAEILAAHLQKNFNIGKNSAVAICMNKCPEAVISILAILKAGAGYVPLDPHYPRDRLQIMVEDSGVPLVLAMRNTAKFLPEVRSVSIIQMDYFWTSKSDNELKKARTKSRDDMSFQNPVLPQPFKPSFTRGASLPVTGGGSGANLFDLNKSDQRAKKSNFLKDDTNDLAYIIFTSGSTGRPKGVAMTRGPLKNLILWQNSVLKKQQGYRTLQFAPISFDVHFQEIFGALTTGGIIVLVDEDIRRDSTSLLRFLRAQMINRIFLPFVALQSLVEASTLLKSQLCIHLEEFITAGEQLKCSKQVLTFFEQNPQASLHNHYGPSETHVVTAYTLSGPPASWPLLPPIGKELPACYCYILDEKGKPVPPGEEGELYIGGVCVARGYVNRPDVTSERFIADTQQTGGSKIMYRTGDKCSMMKDGNIVYLGRLDGQVKIRGHRVEVLEIENTINQHPWVATEAVIAIEVGDSGLKQLVAYVVPQPEYLNTDSLIFVTELRNHCKGSLPDYMVPSAFVKLLVLPLTPSGKLDRRALPQPEALRNQLNEDGSRELNEGTEKKLGEIWCSIFGVNSVSPADDFFAMGGHSLTITQIIVRISNVSGVRLTAKEIFASPKLSDMASLVDSKIGKNDTLISSKSVATVVKALPEISNPTDNGTPLWNLSFGQESLLFMSKLSPDANSALNISYASEIKNSSNTIVSVNEESLSAASNYVVSANEALRTIYVDFQGKSYARLLSNVPTSFFVHNSSNNSTEMESAVREMSSKPLNIQTGPIFKVILFKCKNASVNPVLLFVVHHIAVDLWSLMIIMKQFISAYDILSSSPTKPLPVPTEPEINMFDFAAWQRSVYSLKENTTPSAVYWSEMLNSATLEPLEMPLDFPRPPITSFVGSSIRSQIPMEITSQLNSIVRKHGSTTYSALLAAYSIMLSRYATCEDVVIGTPLANRSASVILENVVGYFINPVPMRCSVNVEESFVTILKRVTNTVLNGIANQDYPFPLLVDRFGGKRESSRSPIFQTMLVWQSTTSASDDEEYVQLVLGEESGKGLSLGRDGLLQLHPRVLDANVAQYEITLHVVQTQDGSFSCTWQYNTSLFSRETVERFSKHFEVLLFNITSEPEIPVSSLQIIQKTEFDLILRNWGGLGKGKASWDFNYLIHQKIEATVMERPNDIAIVHNEKIVSYRELNDKANALVVYLRFKGVKLETHVAVCTTRSIEMIVAFLAIMKAGGAYVPLDPTYPKDRLDFMIKHSNSSIILTQASIKPQLLDIIDPKSSIILLSLDTDWNSTISPYAGAKNPQPVGTPDNLINIVYTSGSTGRPKGVMVSHKSMANLMEWFISEFRLKPVDKVSQLISIGFDPLAQELWPTLIVGGSIYIGDDDLRLSPEKLLKWTTSLGITVLSLATPLAELLLKLEWPITSKVRLVYVGGDKLHSGPSEKMNFELYNLYGPAEATVASTFHKCIVNEDSPPIGTPIGNARAYVLDAKQNPVPIGVLGELCIAGEGLSRGYYDDNSQTSKKFIRDPFSGDNQKMYLTGDLVRYLPNGKLSFVGRVDNQVKIRGQRVELGEIEASCIESNLLKEVIVRVEEYAALGKIIEAFVVPKDKKIASNIADSLLNYLKSKLPTYMIPSKIYVADALPRTSNGKLVRKGLIEGASEVSAHDTKEKRILPATVHEEILASAWSQLLGVQNLAMDDDFFELGGHSLMATHLVSAIRKSFGFDPPISLIFEHSILENQAKAIALFGDEQNESKNSSKKVKLEPLHKALKSEDLKDPHCMSIVAPLSYNEKSMWFMFKLDKSSAAYNCNAAFRILSEVDPNVLKSSVSTLVNRHSILRSQYNDLEDGTPYRVISDMGPDMVSFTTVSMEGADMNVITQKLMHCISQPFNLRQGPLMRTTLMKRKEKEYILLFEWHHIAIDGWSIGLLLQEFAIIFEANISKKKISLPEVNYSYIDYASWQNLSLTKVDITNHVAFWRDAMGGAIPPLSLHTDHPRPPVNSSQGASITTFVNRQLVLKLAKLGKSTTFSAMLAAYFILLNRYTGQTDLVAGVPFAMRDAPGVAEIIGYTVNTVPVLVKVSEELSFVNVLNRVRSAMLKSFQHQDLPFAQLVEHLKVARDPSRSPIYQTLFSFDAAIDSSVNILQLLYGHTYDIVNIGGMDFQPIHVPETTSQMDLSIIIADSGVGDLCVKWQYNTKLFDEESIKRMSSSYINLMEGCCEKPNVSIAHVRILSPLDEELIMRTWNDTSVDYSEKAMYPVHVVFEDFALKFPHSIALTYGNKCLSYTQLNSRSNELAHYLRKDGVEPGSAVAVCCRRSIDMVISMIAVLKVGAAYVACDPAYPANRLQYMLEDSHVSVILGHAFVADRLVKPGAKILLLDTQWPAMRNEFATSNLACVTSVKDVINIMYTSGSTGKPKGIMVEHRNIWNLLCWHHDFFNISGGDRHTQVIAPAFDPVAMEIWVMLTIGGSVHICDDETRLSPAEFIKFVGEREISVCILPTPVAELVLQGDWPADTPLRILYTGGDKLHFGPKKKLPFQLFNLYGPAECAILTTVHLTRMNEESPPIGRPIANTQMYILDKNMEPVPIGVPGELFIGGNSLARGYHERTELTNEKFLKNPFMSSANARIYRTGDLVRYLSNGSIEFLGRIDTQVKIRGNRVELGEIEAACLESGCCKEACVIAVDIDTAQGASKVLAAYVVPFVEGSEVDLMLLRAYLAERLPEYEIPAGFTIISSLPLTPNGKVDRKLLPPPNLTTGSLNGDKEIPHVPPRTPLEKQVASVWCSVLNLSIENISIHDNFFEVGGHSMAAAQLIALLNDQFNTKLRLFKIFQAPTIAGVSGVIDEILYGLSPSTKKKELKEDNDGLGSDIAKQMLKDSTLIDDISTSGLSKAPLIAKTLLITGATGFLGAYLLSDLLRKTNCHIYCIVRGKDSHAASNRLEKILQSWGLFTPAIADSYSRRVRVLKGDLGEPKLGVGDDVWDVLSSLVDVIYHNGANVHFIKPYNALRNDNVLGTVEVVKLATTNTVKTIHYVSTLSTMLIPISDEKFHSFGASMSPSKSTTNLSSQIPKSPSSSDNFVTFTKPLSPSPSKVPVTTSQSVCYENSKMPAASEIHGGYAQSKWVAEQIIWSAFKIGVPVTIHRPGRITGDSRTGVANLEDMLFLVLKGCIQIESFPDISWNIDMAPVDWVSDVITSVCSSPSLMIPGKAYHIMSKSFVPLTELFEWFFTRGFALKKLTYKAWREVLMSDRDAAMSNAVYTLLPLLDEGFESAEGPDIPLPKVDSANTDTCAIKCPDITHELLEIYLQYFIKSGFLHAQQSLKLTAVRIGSYEISGSRFDRHVNFIIHVNFGTTTWKVKKRYRDFSKLEAELTKEFDAKGLSSAHINKPEMPEKGFFKSFDPEYISQKAKKLDTYLKDIVEIFQPSDTPAVRKFFDTQTHIPMGMTPNLKKENSVIPIKVITSK